MTDITVMNETIERQHKRLSESYEVMEAAYKVIVGNEVNLKFKLDTSITNPERDRQRFIELWDKFHGTDKKIL